MNDVIKTNGVVFVLQDQYYGHKLKKLIKNSIKILISLTMMILLKAPQIILTRMSSIMANYYMPIIRFL
jgi:hypothetical protein